ncbi:MAG: hypothetical protein WCO47_05290 [Methylococcus sp.]|jgi:hypothetical protein
MANNPIEPELKRYQALQEELLSNHENKFVIIHGEDPYDVFETFEDALKIGYEKYTTDPFLVRQVLRIPQVLNFTRFSLGQCQA